MEGGGGTCASAWLFKAKWASPQHMTSCNTASSAVRISVASAGRAGHRPERAPGNKARVKRRESGTASDYMLIAWINQHPMRRAAT